jgi:hypothetical protein
LGFQIRNLYRYGMVMNKGDAFCNQTIGSIRRGGAVQVECS